LNSHESSVIQIPETRYEKVMEIPEEVSKPADISGSMHGPHLPQRPLGNFALPLAVSSFGGALGIAAGLFLGVLSAPPANQAAVDEPAPIVSQATQTQTPAAATDPVSTPDPATQPATPAATPPAQETLPAPAPPPAPDSNHAQPSSTPSHRLPGKLSRPRYDLATTEGESAVRKAAFVLDRHSAQIQQVAEDAAAPVTARDTEPYQFIQSSLYQQDATISKTDTSRFSVEGDLEVVDFDLAAGKLETSDGRSFLLDAANFDNASNWRDDRRDVHYRCGQSGVCVIKGPGAAPMSARLI
jgi:hypothetical protein